MLNPASALSSPDWFLERFHIETQTFTLVRTTRALLHEAAFHDGRTDLKIRPDIIHVKIDEALDWLETQKPSTPHRIIAHTSFCGSTLLARAMDVPQHVLMFREPQVFIDFSNLKNANHRIYQNSDIWSRLLTFVLKQFQKSWLPSQSTIIKPSNWANTILPDISKLDISATFVLVSMNLNAYLIANLRGGKDRLKYSLDLLNHLLIGQKSYGHLAKSIQSSNASPLQQTLCMLALCHALQLQTFMDLDGQYPGQCHWLTKSNLTGNPEKAIMDVARQFSLAVPPAELKANIAISLQYNSKINGTEYFDRNSERNMNATLSHAYASDIAAAVEWYETSFPDIVTRTKDRSRMVSSA